MKDAQVIEFSPSNSHYLKPLFEHSDSPFLWSFFQGHMGQGWGDDFFNPTCGRIKVGDCLFLAGDASRKEAFELVKLPPSRSAFMLLIPLDEGWDDLIERTYRGHFKKYHRYAFQKTPQGFSVSQLTHFINRLPNGYELHPIDRDFYHQTFEQDFSKDFCSLFDSAADYEKRGIGFCITHQGKIVSAASSYTVYDGGIEIEIGTHPDYRLQGLATCCAAQLVLRCLQANRYPHWDAANKASVELAKKLGYHFDRAYDTYEIEILDRDG